MEQEPVSRQTESEAATRSSPVSEGEEDDSNSSSSSLDMSFFEGAQVCIIHEIFEALTTFFIIVS